MLALARFILASRARAALVACAGNLLPLLSPATVALVALRHGGREGSLVALWSVLPLVVMLYTGGVAPALVWASLLTVVVVMVAAIVLRSTSSWQLALLALVAASAVAALGMGQVLTTEVSALGLELKAMFVQMLAARGQRWDPDATLVLGLLGWVMAVSALGALLLGRWWQALLYNPGGLGLEFRALRLQPSLALVLMAGLLGSQLGPVSYAAWGNLSGLPLFMSGLALVHHLVAASPRVGTHWLAVFYICLVLLLGPLGLLLTGLGFIDSLIDLRARFGRRGGDPDRPH